jgi:hypothetical protein
VTLFRSRAELIADLNKARTELAEARVELALLRKENGQQRRLNDSLDHDYRDLRRTHQVFHDALVELKGVAYVRNLFFKVEKGEPA